MVYNGILIIIGAVGGGDDEGGEDTKEKAEEEERERLEAIREAEDRRKENTGKWRKNGKRCVKTFETK